MAKGIVIIPEGNKNKKSVEIGFPYEVSCIYDYSKIVGFAQRRECKVLFLTSYYGVVSLKSTIGADRIDLRGLSREKFLKWNLLICEEIVRSCVANGTTKVFLMCKEFNRYGLLVTEVRKRGIQVETPLLGKTLSLQERVLDN